MAGKGQGTDKRLTFTAALENMERMSAGGTWLEGGRQEKVSLYWSAGGLWLEALWYVAGQSFAKSEIGCAFVWPRNGGTACFPM